MSEAYMCDRCGKYVKGNNQGVGCFDLPKTTKAFEEFIRTGNDYCKSCHNYIQVKINEAFAKHVKKQM